MILLTGATGYIGGRLLRPLEERGEQVRCLTRRPEALQGRLGPNATAVYGDLDKPETLPPALEGVTTAYYLVHALGARGDFEAKERIAAKHFAGAAQRSGVRRIIYLGALSREEEGLSPHMRSRFEVGRILRQSGVPTTEFRASIVIGSGSLSFELMRALVHRLPVMVTPKWVSVDAQPIAVNDVMAYLLKALDQEDPVSRVYEIGGSEVLTYGELMHAYAEERGLKRYMIRVPVLTPRLSSLWLGLVTPVYARVGRKLIDSVTTASVVRDESALRDFAIRPAGARQAIRQALDREDHQFIESSWADAVSTSGEPASWGGVRFGRRIVEAREAHVQASPDSAWAVIRRIGGKTGWYYGNALWKLRGALDLMLGGVGFRRGRRDPNAIRAGDVIDFWRVESCEAPRRLVLAAEMKLPGRAWLQFEVEPKAAGGARIQQTALFDPIGYLGLVYWYALYPLHALIFRGMIARIAEAAEAEPARPR
jgi:uncharacterized protein YbjT (DUF2867 family)